MTEISKEKVAQITDNLRKIVDERLTADGSEGVTATSTRVSIPQSAVFGLLKDLGITEQSVRQRTEADTILHVATVNVLGEKTAAAVKEAVAASLDPKEVEFTLSKTLPGITTRDTMRAVSTGRNPRTGEETVTYGRVRHTEKISKSVGEDAYQAAAKLIQAEIDAAG